MLWEKWLKNTIWIVLWEKSQIEQKTELYQSKQLFRENFFPNQTALLFSIFAKSFTCDSHMVGELENLKQQPDLLVLRRAKNVNPISVVLPRN